MREIWPDSRYFPLPREKRQTVSETNFDFFLKSFPHTRRAFIVADKSFGYYPKLRLVTWHPRGVFDDILADQIVEFIEAEERSQEAPFNRYTDLSEITNINLTAGHVFQIAQRRHAASEPVKSAFWSDKAVTLSLAYIYETLMAAAAINVRVFMEREAAAAWLGVPVEILHQAEEPSQMPASQQIESHIAH